MQRIPTHRILQGLGFAASLPCAAVGAWRLPELLDLGALAQVVPGYPPWFLGFLWVLVLGPLLLGGLGVLDTLLLVGPSAARVEEEDPADP